MMVLHTTQMVMVMFIKKLVPLVLAVMLVGCSSSDSSESSEAVATPSEASFEQVMFLTTDGGGVSSHPFDYGGEYTVEWSEQPSWTALPVVVHGEIDGTTITDATATPYQYTRGTTDAADAYYNVIEYGYQEKFEDLFVEIYDKLNDEMEDSNIDATPLQQFLEFIGSDTKYGNLRDYLTDALVVVKEHNDGNYDKTDLNERASIAYNGVYHWFFSFSVDDLTN